LLTEADLSAVSKIERTIRMARSWLFIGVMSGMTEAISANEPSLSEDDLMSLAEEAEGIIVGAYDGEGFLLWTKR
jgi:hypothetical protein